MERVSEHAHSESTQERDSSNLPPLKLEQQQSSDFERLGSSSDSKSSEEQKSVDGIQIDLDLDLL